MDDRRLRYFLAVVDEGSVTRAAQRLRVAQPSLSQTLRALESELDVELFHRVGRGVRLSTAGETLVGPARQILRAIDDARTAISGVVELRTGTLEIAALATLAVDPMAALIGRFREHHPGIQVRVLEPESADGVRALVGDGACELGAAHLPLPGDQLTALPLGEQELLFVFPPHAAPANERPVGARELARTPLVVSPPGTSTRMLLEQALAAVGVTPQIAVQTAREAIVALVLAGAGAALLPTPLAREAQRRGAIARSAQPAITRTVGLIHRQGPALGSSPRIPRARHQRRLNPRPARAPGSRRTAAALIVDAPVLAGGIVVIAWCSARSGRRRPVGASSSGGSETSAIDRPPLATELDDPGLARDRTALVWTRSTRPGSRRN
ncbi:MAG: LysR family transcriptional regulator [Solirubrobacteraceae bacterium]